jgi:hypothetical protein
MMDRQPKEKGMTEEQLQEFLDKGGKIQYFPPGARTEEIDYKGGFYGRKKKKNEDSE